MAAHLAFQIVTKDLRNVFILLRVENTTAIAYINKMVGILFTKFNELAQSLWTWCKKRKIHVFAL